MKWDASATSEGVTLYATVGASASVTPQRSGHLVEFLGLSPARDEVASAFAALGLYAAHHDANLDHGHTVPSGEPLWPGTTIRHFLTVRPQTEFLDPLVLPGGRHIELLQAIPIFETEIAYKSQEGVDALLARWEADRMRSGTPTATMRHAGIQRFAFSCRRWMLFYGLASALVLGPLASGRQIGIRIV